MIRNYWPLKNNLRLCDLYFHTAWPSLIDLLNFLVLSRHISCVWCQGLHLWHLSLITCTFLPIFLSPSFFVCQSGCTQNGWTLFLFQRWVALEAETGQGKWCCCEHVQMQAPTLIYSILCLSGVDNMTLQFSSSLLCWYSACNISLTYLIWYLCASMAGGLNLGRYIDTSLLVFGTFLS